MSDADGIWRFHVMPCENGWKVVEAGKTRSVHSKKGAAVAAARRAYRSQNAKGERAGIVNHVGIGVAKEELFGGPRKVRMPNQWYANLQSAQER